jgi:3-dehydro-L-gulonate 2-dehydrogenase
MVVTATQVYDLIADVLRKKGVHGTDVELCSSVLTENTLCGVASHGINRVHVLAKLIDLNLIHPAAEAELVHAMQALEVWDGKYGLGIKNAWKMTRRAMELAEQFGVGCIALRDTNHWMRAGMYGYHAAENGFIFICWTNTIANLPPWGAKEARTGNNPIVFAVPRHDGPVVIDMALSQYSYGKLSTYRRAGKPLPYAGGFDKNGELTTDAGEIYSTFRPLPIGLWKGAGLSLLLDLIAAVLSGGKTTQRLSEHEHEAGLSQVFIAINPASAAAENYQHIIDETLGYYLSAEPINENEPIRYPGQQVRENRERNLRAGIEVEDEIWDRLKSLL